ncbi:AT-rich interactive domain-containing protein 4 [Hibiscus syriacus]|uniref:AT-rich interactive domain-containing protein 4 n=1 Tax=Hibiscus syriacus TaxID=106335 RepID=A0A6A3B852_HIBSY|nr:AT-rich interactive domain-containing protein 4 [Hibiscus syriacus]
MISRDTVSGACFFRAPRALMSFGVLDSSEPNVVYLQGEQNADSDEIGCLVWGDADLSTPEALCGLFDLTLPTTMIERTRDMRYSLYMQCFGLSRGPNGDKLAEALHTKGVPYVILEKYILCYAACHFRQALLSVIQRMHSFWDLWRMDLMPLKHRILIFDSIYPLINSIQLSFVSDTREQAPQPSKLLENHIKNELIEKSQLVCPHSSSEESKSEPVDQPRLPVEQILRQLARDVSYRSLVMLGIASIQGLSVASFEKDDAERILFFCKNPGKDPSLDSSLIARTPSWCNGIAISETSVAAMRPIPHTHHHKMLPFSGFSETEKYDGEQGKVNLPIVPVKQPAVTHRKALSSSYMAQQIMSLNPLPLKKHGCGRTPIQVCSEEEFLRDVMRFLILRGHTRLVPQGGLAEFPDAVLNAKRLDLLTCGVKRRLSCREWHKLEGTSFSKMRNHTLTNRMTGVGNTLKRHYETYLLEYELAHDDVDGECCLLCHRSLLHTFLMSLCIYGFVCNTDQRFCVKTVVQQATGVNCGVCGEWAHFGCDRRQGLGAFKDYAKTDGLEYVCPHCSISDLRRNRNR